MSRNIVRLLTVCAIVLGALVGLAASRAVGATHSPCTSLLAVAPYVSDVTDGVTTIGGAGQIGGCPVPVGTEGVAITVCLQARPTPLADFADIGWTVTLPTGALTSDAWVDQTTALIVNGLAR